MTALEEIVRCVDAFLATQPRTIEIEIIKHLQNMEIAPFDEFNLSQSHDLFRAHFLLKHCLYKLQDSYLGAQNYLLEISLTKIERQLYAEGQAALLPHDAVKAYYLDITHYFETEEDDVNKMLTGFWSRFLGQSEKQSALKVLALSPEASYQQVKLQYKRLAQREHPDKGGCEERFKRINAAKRLLEKVYL